MHIAVDGRGRDTFRWTRATAERFCHQAVRLAAMTLISGPHSEAAGSRICAIAILAESHVAAHLDTATREAHLEMFSCNDFPSPLFAELCRSSFDLEAALAVELPRLGLGAPLPAAIRSACATSGPTSAASLTACCGGSREGASDAAPHAHRRRRSRLG